VEYIIKIKKDPKNLLNDSWVWKMAWRDARRNFSRLFLFISSIIIGIAALVAINSFNENLQNDINIQAKDLLGADFIVKSNKAFEDAALIVFDTLPAEQSWDARMASMVLFVSDAGGTRLVQIVAIEGNFPFYGEAETLPPGSFNKVKSGKYTLLDENIAIQYEVSSDDSIKVGNVTFPVAGIVKNIPGGGGVNATFAPSVYIPMKYLEETGLIQFGSRVNYKRYFRVYREEDNDKILEQLKPTLKKYGYSYETVQQRKESLGRGFENLFRFFNLLAFVALILGSIGVASSVHIYVQEKKETVGVLRCLGASGWQAFNIFFIQTVILGFIGSLAGAFLGIIIQYLVPLIIADYIPINISVSISWISIGEGLLLGLIISILFSILPLTSVRNIPPLVVLRTGFESIKKFSKVRLLIILLTLLFPLVFAIYQTQSWINGLAFFSALVASFLCLTLVAKGLILFVRKFFPHQWGFIWRQSLANLFRPNNQTTVLVVVIGLGAFLVTTLQLVQNSLLNQVEFIGSGNRSNTVLFDIQPYQKDGVIELVKKYDFPIQQLAPIVTTRLSRVNGKTIKEMQQDTTDNIPNWSITREYRVTYRDSLIDSETLVKGDLMKEVKSPNDSIKVSITDSMAENLELEIGDEVIFDVQGVPITTYIGSIRDVDWQRIQTNFIFVFPNGVLEKAPQFYVLMTKTDSKPQASKFQRELVIGYPNIAVIDLSLILATIDEFMSKVAFVIQFMALFSIATGLVVLAGAVINSKYIRLKENVLLRTLGALKKQIVSMTLIEYGYLGLFAGLTGILLSLLASWGLAILFFDIIFFPDFTSMLVIWLGVSMLTMIIGWLNTRSILNNSPLEVLRKEV